MAYQAYLQQWQKGKGVAGGADVAIHKPELFTELLNLDLAGQREFIRLIVGSEDEAFNDDLYRCEAINLCLSAMADRNPEEALDILLHPDEQIGEFYGERGMHGSMLTYTLTRLAEFDPFAAANRIVELVGSETSDIPLGRASPVIKTIIKREPRLALETIPRLPAELHLDCWRPILPELETQGHLQLAIDVVLDDTLTDRAVHSYVLSQLFIRKRTEEQNWSSWVTWIDQLNLSTQQKQHVAPAFGHRLEEAPEYADWLQSFLPKSTERDFLLWRATKGFWDATDPAESSALLKRQGIDPKEMEQLEQDGFLRIPH